MKVKFLKDFQYYYQAGKVKKLHKVKKGSTADVDNVTGGRWCKKSAAEKVK